MKTKKVIITPDNMRDFLGQRGRLSLIYNDKVLKEFATDNVYALYNTLRSLSKRRTGTYSKLPRNFVAEFERM